MPLHTPYCAESDFCVCWMDPKPLPLSSRKEAAVAILGAGFAGLSVADQLINRYGFKNVTVYEALDRIGGRAHTVKFGQGFVELGAQFIQNLPNSIVLKMAQDLGAVQQSNHSSLLNLFKLTTANSSTTSAASSSSSSSTTTKLLHNFSSSTARRGNNNRHQQKDVCLREGGSSLTDEKLLAEFRRLLLNTEMQAAKGKLKLTNFPRHVKRSLGAVQTYEYNEWKMKRRLSYCSNASSTNSSSSGYCSSNGSTNSSSGKINGGTKGTNSSRTNEPTGLSDQQSKDLDLLFKFATKAAEFDYGCDDWDDVSLASTSQFYTVTECDRDFQLLPVTRAGYSVLVDHLASKLPASCLKLCSPCTSINWQGPRVELDFDDENNQGSPTSSVSSVTVEHVVVTVPLGVLKRRASTMFSPPLPIAKKLAIDGLGVGNVEKLFAKFEKSFWKNNVRRYELLWGEPSEEECEELRLARSFFVLQPVSTSTNVVCLWTTGVNVKNVWRSAESTLKNVVQRLVLKFFPFVDEKLAYPIAILRSNWSGNKYFSGSYSYYNMKYDEHKHGPLQLAEPLYSASDDGDLTAAHRTPLVLFAGEATCAHCYGTTHGALTSGHREARRLHLFYKKRSATAAVGTNAAQQDQAGAEDAAFISQKASCFGGVRFRSLHKTY